MLENQPFIIIKHFRTHQFNKKVCFRKWTAEENDIFARKLEENLDILVDRELRKKKRIFRLIAVSIPTKSSKQVKSHHQKLMQRHGSLQKIISSYKKENDVRIKVEQSEMEQSESQQPIKEEECSPGSDDQAVKKEWKGLGVAKVGEIKTQPQLECYYYYY